MDKPRWSLRITRSGAEQKANVFVRQHQFVVGAPVSFDEKHPFVTALEYALGALGADLVNGLAELAHKRRVEIDHIEAVVHGELDDALAHAGVVGAAGNPGLAWVGLRVYVSTLDEEAALRTVWKDVLDRSPLAKTLERAIKLEVTLKAT